MKQQPADTEEVVELTPAEIAELDDRADAVERGEFVTAEALFDELRAMRERSFRGRSRLEAL